MNGAFVLDLGSDESDAEVEELSEANAHRGANNHKPSSKNLGMDAVIKDREEGEAEGGEEETEESAA